MGSTDRFDDEQGDSSSSDQSAESEAGVFYDIDYPAEGLDHRFKQPAHGASSSEFDNGPFDDAAAQDAPRGRHAAPASEQPTGSLDDEPGWVDEAFSDAAPGQHTGVVPVEMPTTASVRAADRERAKEEKAAEAPIRAERIHHELTPGRKRALGIALAVIAVVAVFGVWQYSQYAKMSALDATAQQIYEASSSHIATLKSQNKLSTLSTDVVKEGTEVTAQPADYTGDNWSDVSLYRVHRGDDAVDSDLLGTSSLNIPDSADYWVELSPSTGQIYGVFYSESSISESQIDGLHNRDRSGRIAQSIGYYGGQGDLEASGEASFKGLKTELVNGNELYVRLYGVKFSQLIQDESALTVTLEVTGAKDASTDAETATATLTYVGGKDFTIGSTDTEIDFVLDSMREGMTFADVLGKSGIMPGADVTVKTTVSYQSSAYTSNNCQGLSDKTANSLFSQWDRYTKTVDIANLRHLNNLREDICPAGATSTTKFSFSNVNLTQDIDFNPASWNLIDTSGMQSVSMQSRYEDEAFNPITQEKNAYGGLRDTNQAFTPIANDGVFVNATDATFRGNNHRIMNFIIQSDGDCGLFSMAGMTFKDLQIVDPYIVGGGSTGAIVGILTGTGGFSNCNVHLEEDGADGSINANYRIVGGANTGGLVGLYQASGNTTDCFAAVAVEGTDCVGGFAGRVESTGAIKQCYSSGTVVADDEAGGFVGYLAGTVADGFSTSGVRCSGVAGGFVGRCVSGALTNDVVLGRVMDKSGSANAASTTAGGFAGVSAVTSTGCTYLQMHNCNEFNAEGQTSAGATAQGYAALCSATPLDADKTHSYAASQRDKQFPFTVPYALSSYYGNWPEKVSITFKNAEGSELQAYDLLSGDRPAFTGAISTDPVVDADGFSITTFDGWTDASGVGYDAKTELPAATADATYTERSTVIKWEDIVTSLFASGDTPLYSYLAQSSVSTDGQVIADVSLHSAMSSSTAQSIDSYMADSRYDINQLGWGLRIAAGSSSDAANLGIAKKDSNDYKDNACAYLGVRATAAGQTVKVVEYDVGRAHKGQPAFRQGTISSVSSGGGVGYDPDTFAATSGWFSTR